MKIAKSHFSFTYRGKKKGRFKLKSKNEMENSNYGISGTENLMALPQVQGLDTA